MTEVESYFNAERSWCLFGSFVGLFSAALAIFLFLMAKQVFYKGLAYPLLLIGLLFLIVCSSVYLRSPNDLLRVQAFLDASPENIHIVEIPRMEKVLQSFRVIIAVELTLILGSVVVLFFSRSKHLLRGVCSGILTEAVLLLLFDVMAQQRGNVYFEFLISYANS